VVEEVVVAVEACHDRIAISMSRSWQFSCSMSRTVVVAAGRPGNPCHNPSIGRAGI